MNNTEDKKYNHFLLLGLRLNGRCKRGKCDGKILNFEKIFDSKINIKYSIIFTDEFTNLKINMRKNKNDFKIFQGIILVSSEKELSLMEGMHYAYAIETLLPITYFCIAKRYEGFSVLPMKNETLKNLMKPITFKNILKESKEEIIEYFGENEFFLTSYKSFTLDDLDWFTSTLPYLKSYIIDDNFQRGCHYLYLSMWELGYDVCDWSEDNFNDSFYRFVPLGKAESSFFNAFKAIESILGGEPSKNKERLRKRLIEYNFNPDEKVGFIKKQKILNKIIDYHNTRDKIAAHGVGKLKRALKLSEIIDLQKLAQFLLLRYGDPNKQKNLGFKSRH